MRFPTTKRTKLPTAAERVKIRQLESLLAESTEPLPAGFLERALRTPEQRTGLPAWVGVGASVAAAVVAALVLLLPNPPPATTTPRTATAPVPAEPIERTVEMADRTMPVLHRLARGRDGPLARAAIVELGRRAESTSLPVLADVVERADRRAAVIDALGAFDDPRAVAALEPFVDEPELSARTLDAIRRIGGDAAAQALVRRIRSGSGAPPRATLVTALGACGGAYAALELARLLDDPTVAATALAALRQYETALVPHLLEAARAQWTDEAEPALAALERLAPPMAVPVLVPLLDRRRHRSAAARILAAIDSAEATDALLAALPAPDVREAFRRAGRKAEAHLLDGIRDARHRDQVIRIDLLGLCGTGRSVPTLETLAERPALAPHVVSTLGRIGGERAVDTLARLAARPALARDAIDALGWTGSPAAVARLVELGLGDRQLRDPAVRALGRIAHPDAVQAIVHLDGDLRLRRSVVQALRAFDRDLAVPALVALLDGDHARAARRALTTLGIHRLD